MPFSDPLADGPTIQHSTQVALEQGMTLTRGLALTSRLREAGVTQPLLLMGYVNPILAYGVSRYVADAEAAGADGFIVPDLPPEEAGGARNRVPGARPGAGLPAGTDLHPGTHRCGGQPHDGVRLPGVAGGRHRRAGPAAA